MESWSIEVDKEYFQFSAAHFLIFPDGTPERLHGHNYRVYARVRAALSNHGLVLDFQQIKPVVRELVDELDEHLILPGRHPGLRIESLPGGATAVSYRDRRYQFPAEDALVLPVNNSSAENLSTYLGRELMSRLLRRFPDLAIERLELAVEETPGQRAVWRYESPAA